MTMSVNEILEVLERYGIRPLEEESEDNPLEDKSEDKWPAIGRIEDDELVYPTTVGSAYGSVVTGDESSIEMDDSRIAEWWKRISEIREQPAGGVRRRSESGLAEGSADPPEPACAWYCPVHFFGNARGIYIRENCIMSEALEIATHVDWSKVVAAPAEIQRQLLRSAFYVFFLHEQFHHKVESFGLRLLIATGTDRYRPYKRHVYRQTFHTQNCLEESLANADSYRRLIERRYVTRLDPAIYKGTRERLKASIPRQSPGYAEGVQYFPAKSYRDGLFQLQSQILEGQLTPVMPAQNWAVAPNMMTALEDIDDEIYIIVPQGSRPLFRSASVDPGSTASSRDLENALTRRHGYQRTRGGKGSHVKLTKPGAPTITLPANRSDVSPHIARQVLSAIGDYPLSRLPDLIAGRL
jgi:predicted RNA binding protein YcfA (HicA-like mRNA interferase family)